MAKRKIYHRQYGDMVLAYFADKPTVAETDISVDLAVGRLVRRHPETSGFTVEEADTVAS